jgi:predicted Zn-dependent protease
MSMSRLIILSLVALTAYGCATNPVTGHRDLALISEAEEIELGRKSDAEVRQQYGVYTDAALQAYVQQVGEKVASHSHRPGLRYHFTVLDSADVNAFALPGGYIYITRGILAYLNSEAELAAVLGHEVGHVTARHSVRQYSAAMAASIGYNITALFLPPLQSKTGQSIFNSLGGALLSGYGRDHELEADRLGAEYLARSAYDPQAMIGVIGVLKNQELFERQQAAAQGREARAYHGVFASHPSADQRLQQVVREADKFRSPNAVRLERSAYMKKLQGLVFGASEQQGIVRGENFYHQGLGVVVTFPKGWRLDNQPDHVVALNPAKDALLYLAARDAKTGVSPQTFIRDELKVSPLQQGRALSAASQAGYTGIARMNSPFGARNTRVSVVYLNNKAFIFFGTQQADSADLRHDRDFLAAAASLHPLTPKEAALARAARLHLVSARPGDTFARLARDVTAVDNAESLLRLINDKYPRGEPASGDILKIIR